MKPIEAADIVAALSHCDPRALAGALAASPDPILSTLADAVMEAAEHKANYPSDEVIAEADALLYDVLRWPIDDGLPQGVSIDPVTFAHHRQIPLAEAQQIVEHLAATEGHAVDQLIESGVRPNFTVEQAQVYDCITVIRAEGRIPTRALVREHATIMARSAMRPSDGHEPLVYPTDRGLAPRIISPSPKVQALLWLQRMDAHPPATGIIEDRIAFVSTAKSAMGQNAELLDHLEHSNDVPAPTRPQNVGRANLRLAG